MLSFAKLKFSEKQEPLSTPESTTLVPFLLLLPPLPPPPPFIDLIFLPLFLDESG